MKFRFFLAILLALLTALMIFQPLENHGAMTSNAWN